jgi:hypothetical protein
MARIRSIKPDFWTDEKLTECSMSARLLFIGTWNFADDYGNLDRSAKQIKARVFPIDSVDCEPLLQELLTQGLLIEYSVNEKKYLHIKGFTKHQVINRPSAPQCPMYEDSLSTHAGEEGKGEEGKGTAKRPLPDDWNPSSKTTERLSREFGLVPEDVDRYVAAFRDSCKAKGYKYANFDSAFSNCVRQDWPKFRNGAERMPQQGASW